MFLSSGHKRARISTLALKKIAKRKRLRAVFIEELTEQLDEQGFLFFENERGFALLPWSALDGAPPLTRQKHLTKKERKQLTSTPDDFYSQVESEVFHDDEEEEYD